jgi:FMN reductase
MTTRTIVVVSAGLSQPSSTRMLADKLADRTVAKLAERDIQTTVETFELRDVATDIMNHMLTGFPSPRLEAVIDAVTGADGLIAVSPIFTTSYSGLFKSFFDVVGSDALVDLPVVIGATAGTPRHSLALDYALRPMFTYLHAIVAPTGVFAATGDWGDSPDSVKTLPNRIDRAAGELAALVSTTDRSATVRDPFALDRPFGHLIGGLAGE